MKRLFILLISFVMLASCATSDAGNADSSTGSNGTAQPEASGSGVNEFAGTTIRISDPRFSAGTELITSDPSRYVIGGLFDYTKLSQLSGMDLEVHGFTDENRTLKILAGDKDIDVYFFFHDDAKYILDNNLVSPIDSDIIDEFNSKTFDCLQDVCVDKSGNTIMMPLEYSIFSLFVPKQAVEELGLTAQDIEYWEDFYNYLTDYNGPRKSYGNGMVLFYLIEMQYHYYHCDLDNGEFDYDNEDFRRLYETLLGNWVFDGQSYNQPYFLNVPLNNFDPDENLFDLNGISRYLSLSDPENNEMRAQEFVTFPVPKYDEKVEKNMLSVASFAYINPYSENKEAAVKLLETIAENYYSIVSSNCAYFIFSDTSMYPKAIDTESQLFKDFIAMSDNSEILFYDFNDVVSEIDHEYTCMELTLDEAIEERTRVVDIKLNE